MRKENSEFETAFVTEAGSFIDNRDYFAYMETEDMACYVLADGLDTDRELNSAEMAVKAVLENFMEKPSMSKRRLERGLRDAQEWLQFESRRVRLKASLLMIVTDYTRMVYAATGNVRLYHFRGKRLNFRSRDHSLAQSLVDDGRVPEDKAHVHEERNNLLEYLGKPGGVRAFFSKKTKLADGDVLLMATPGMWENVELAEMLGALEESKGPADLADTLEEVLLSRQRRIVPNYTAAAVYVNKIYQEKPKNRRKLIKRILIVLLVLLLTGGGTWIAMARMAEKKAESLEQMVESGSRGDDYAEMGNFGKAVGSYSEARNAANRIKDLVNKKIFTNKLNLSQAIVDGDEYADQGDFENAKISYQKALKTANVYLASSSDDIEKKIKDLDAYAEVRSQMNGADLKFQAGEYTEALKLYEQANKAAVQAGYDSAVEEIGTKLQETKDKITAIEQELQEIRAGKLEARGERMLSTGDYSGAIDAYAGAQQIYQGIGKLESVLAMERTIAKIEDEQKAKQQEEEAALAAQQSAAEQAAAAQAAAEQAAAQQAAIEQAAAAAAAAAVKEKKDEGKDTAASQDKGKASGNEEAASGTGSEK